jgi:hypothetical protein
MESKIHKIQTLQLYFKDVLSGDKNFEVRRNDRNYKVGDELILQEVKESTLQPTGRIIHRKITYILYGGVFGVSPDFCVMSLKEI